VETIINDFGRKKMRRHQIFRNWLFSKSTHWQNDRDQGHLTRLLLTILRNPAALQLPYNVLTLLRSACRDREGISLRLNKAPFTKSRSS